MIQKLLWRRGAYTDATIAARKDTPVENTRHAMVDVEAQEQVDSVLNAPIEISEEEKITTHGEEENIPTHAEDKKILTHAKEEKIPTSVEREKIQTEIEDEDIEVNLGQTKTGGIPRKRGSENQAAICELWAIL